MGRTQASVRTEASFQAAAERIGVAARAMKEAFPIALRHIGEEIMADVKASRPGHGVPVKKGTLRGSGIVEGPEDYGRNVQVTLAFGSAAAPYALKQHEEVSFHHDIGESRYLVRGVERWRPGGSAAMAGLKRNAQAAFSGGGRKP